jgi:hypothetical protein
MTKRLVLKGQRLGDTWAKEVKVTAKGVALTYHMPLPTEGTIEDRMLVLSIYNMVGPAGFEPTTNRL